MIVVHHLGVSQSERILWLLEELELPYKIVKHTRAPALAPDSLKNVPGNKTGKSPFIEDIDAGIGLSESNAITDYIIWKHASGRLALPPTHLDFASYIYWKDYANSTMQPAMITAMFLAVGNVESDSMIKQFSDQRLYAALQHMDERLKETKWLAGQEFTAADTMSVYSLTTQRYFGPQVSLAGYDGILRWLKDCSERPAFQRAMEKGDPEMKVLIGPDAPSQSLLDAGGVESNLWKK